VTDFNLPLSIQFGLAAFAASLTGLLIAFNRGWRWLSLEASLNRSATVAGYGAVLFAALISTLSLTGPGADPAGAVSGLWPVALFAVIGVSLVHTPGLLRGLLFAGKPLDETQLAVLTASLIGGFLTAVLASAGV